MEPCICIPAREAAPEGQGTGPSFRDRIAQATVKIMLKPVFEADFLPASFGFRPGRSPA